MKTIAILEGWAGGPKLTRLFRSKLKNAGFAVAKHPKQADIIIAHSVGCYFLPKHKKAKVIVLINPPYWPRRSIVRRQRQMSKNEYDFLLQTFGLRRLLLDRFWQLFYLMAKPAYSYSVLKNHGELDFLTKLDDLKTILVRNQGDEFCSPEIKEVISHYRNIDYVEVPGYHSDYYTNPQPYIDLIIKAI